MPRRVIAVVSLSSCLIISANWMDLSQSDYQPAIKLLRRKRGSLAGGIPPFYWRRWPCKSVSCSEEFRLKIAQKFLNNGRRDTSLKKAKVNRWMRATKSSGCGGLMQRLWLRSPLDVSGSSPTIVFFLLEWEKHFPCGLEGFHEQADGENIVDIKLFLFKGIVVTRWSSHHSK